MRNGRVTPRPREPAVHQGRILGLGGLGPPARGPGPHSPRADPGAGTSSQGARAPLSIQGQIQGAGPPLCIPGARGTGAALSRGRNRWPWPPLARGPGTSLHPGVSSEDPKGPGPCCLSVHPREREGEREREKFVVCVCVCVCARVCVQFCCNLVKVPCRSTTRVFFARGSFVTSPHDAVFLQEIPALVSL